MKCKKRAQLTGHNAGIYALSHGFEAGHFFSTGGDGWIVRWDFDNPDLGKLVAKVDVQVFSLATLVDRQELVAGDMNGGVHWVNMSSPESTKGHAIHGKGVFDIKVFNDKLFTLGGEGKLTRWSVEDRKPIDTFHLTNQSLRCIAISESRRELAIGASDCSIYILDADTLEIKIRIEDAHQNSVFSLKYNRNENKLFSGGRDAALKSWDIENGYLLETAVDAHMYTINSIVLHPSENLVATGSRDKTIKIWDAENLKLLKVLEGGRDKGHFNSVNSLLWHPFQNTLISCSDDRTIILWEVEK